MTKAKQRIQLSKWFFLGVSVAVLIVFWQMIQPYILTLITAAIFTILFAPIDNRLRKLFKNKKVSAFLVTVIVFALIFVPVTLFGVLIVQEAADLAQVTIEGDYQFNPAEIIDLDIVQTLPQFAQDYIATVDVTEMTANAVSWLQSNIGRLIANGASFAFQVFLFFVFLYYFTSSRDRIYKEILDLSPFTDKLDKDIVKRINQTVRGVVFGAIIIASIQAILASMGMLIFGVPKAFLWGSFVLIAAQVPMVGVGLVMVPAIAYLAITGHVAAAIGLAIWSVTAVGLVDNLLSPVLVGKRTKMPELLVLLSILGGLQLFGPIGFIVGPVILAGVLVLRDLYKAGILEKV